MAVRLGDLQTLLGDFEMPEFLTADDDYVCQACGDLVQKNIRVQPRGRALLFHLKRFDNKGRKRNDLVTFPRMLHFGTARYEFAAVVEHIGATMKSGHYVTYLQSENFKCCNDNVITDTTWENVEARQAYLLMYVRADA